MGLPIWLVSIWLKSKINFRLLRLVIFSLSSYLKSPMACYLNYLQLELLQKVYFLSVIHFPFSCPLANSMKIKALWKKKKKKKREKNQKTHSPLHSGHTNRQQCKSCHNCEVSFVHVWFRNVKDDLLDLCCPRR